MLSIRLRYWHLVAFFIWLLFKSQLSAVPTVLVILAVKDLDKGTVHPRQPTQFQRKSTCTAVLALTSPLNVMCGQHQTLVVLPPVHTKYRLFMRWGGLQCQCGLVWKFLPPTGIPSPDCPSHSQSLYQLCYTKGSIQNTKI
jgi:hypothetical protein